MKHEKIEKTVKIEREKGQILSNLFGEWEEALVWSFLQGCMGDAWADNDKIPVSGQIMCGDFCYFAGEPDENLVKNWPVIPGDEFIIMVPQNEEWGRLIEEIYGEKSRKVTRYAIKKERGIFESERLLQIEKELDPKYCIQLIDENCYRQIMDQEWSRDLCSQYGSFEKFDQNALGVVVLYEGTVVSGASSYVHFRDGIEIEIDTREDFRRKGLAAACGARLVRECMERGLYPSWDAQNLWSVALAQKLGYHFDKEYDAYEVTI